MLDTGDGQAMALPVDDAWDVSSSVMPAPLPEPPPQPEPGASWFMQVEPLKQQLTATLTAMLTQWASVYDHSC
ncbi:hypothetical protein NP493_2710g00005 [Ridgeia piscesae]|uniref:Uncharacterized protein n=1 Tax=Ridgeia piscesae TaxID=27915 RepID=A0AAD9MYX6_RIDPI|nr:hypothetical protein NP493_2710g00005 [Ridgeia piscesae]